MQNNFISVPVIIGAIIIFICLDLLLVYYLRNKLSKISDKDKNFVRKQIQEISMQDKSTQIINYDKLLAFCLKKLGKTGSMAEMMKVSSFKNADEIWFAHKLRNKIAHEVDYQISSSDFRKAKQAYLREINSLI